MSQKSKKSSSAITKDMLKSIIKDVVVDTNVLEDAVNESKMLSISCAQAESLCLNSTSVDAVVEKLAEVSCNNEKLNAILSTNIATLLESKSLNITEKTEKLEKNISRLKEENQELKIQQEKLAQYSRRNCLILYGNPHSNLENTDEKVVDFVKFELGVNLSITDLVTSHRLGGSHGPITAKFLSHNKKQEIYFAKKRLKGKPFLVSEALTKNRLTCVHQLKELKAAEVITSYWTIDGSILYIETENPQKKLSLKM